MYRTLIPLHGKITSRFAWEFNVIYLAPFKYYNPQLGVELDYYYAPNADHSPRFNFTLNLVWIAIEFNIYNMHHADCEKECTKEQFKDE